MVRQLLDRAPAIGTECFDEKRQSEGAGNRPGEPRPVSRGARGQAAGGAGFGHGRRRGAGGAPRLRGVVAEARRAGALRPTRGPRVRAESAPRRRPVSGGRAHRARGGRASRRPGGAAGGGRDGRLPALARNPGSRGDGRVAVREGMDERRRWRRSASVLRVESSAHAPRRVDGWRPRAGRRRARNHACRRGRSVDPTRLEGAGPAERRASERSRHPAAARPARAWCLSAAASRLRPGLGTRARAARTRRRREDTARDAPAYRPYDPRDAAATEAAAGKRGEAKERPTKPPPGRRRPTPPPPRRTTARRPTPRRGSFRAGDRRFPRRARNAPPRRHRARCFRSRGADSRVPSVGGGSEKRLTPKKRNPASRRRARPALPPRRRRRLRRRSRRRNTRRGRETSRTPVV